MKNTFTPILILVLFASLSSLSAKAQCPAGYTAAELNWDNLDFLPSNNVRYTTFYPAATFPYTQNFTIGTRTINFALDAALTLNGENGTNTAHTGSFATAGDDVQFTTTVTTNNTITITFDADVANVQFSFFDVDNSQRIGITATNAASTARNITITRATGTSGITVAGSGGTNPTATGPATGYAGTDNRGTINVDIPGTVKVIVITLNNAAGDVWLSDIDACVTGTFPNNYQIVSRPFTGQPQYVLTVVNNNIYYTDPSNGNCYFLFNEPAHNRLNSMAYDPYERIVYYTFSLSSDPTNDRTLKKYDVDTKTISVVIPNVNTFGIPTYESGVESGSATFYNGCLYLGIEGYTGTTGGGAYAASRKSTIWKINFDASGNAVGPAAQVFGVTADDGTNAQNIHDWSDFGISNGVLYDFDGSQSGNIDYYHFNLFSGVRTRYAPVGPIPRQVSIGWNELLYNVDATIARYNGTDGVAAGTTFTLTAPLGPVIPTGSGASWGDAAGPYRPFLDFGDAPATYDPDPLSPACHDTLTPTNTDMRLGPAEDVEWLKRGFTTVEDNFEDGLSFIPIFSPSSGSYFAQVSVLNNTGSNATVCAWLDFNGNGVFDASEGIVPVTVPSAAGTQTVNLFWPSTPSTLTTGSYTYLRIRITSSSFNMTANNATGYYGRGEVEDYRIVVDDFPLSVAVLSFDAKLTDDSKVKLNWSASEDVSLTGYEVERSTRTTEWDPIAYVPASSEGGKVFQYELLDNDPLKGHSQYRIKMKGVNGQVRYSTIRTIQVEMTTAVTVFPNPVSDRATIAINGDVAGLETHIYIMDARGNPLTYKKVTLAAGTNILELTIPGSWSAGVYMIRVSNDRRVATKQFVLRR